MSEWISVKDRLPENYDYVLAAVKFYDVPLIAWYGEKRGWRILDSDYNTGEGERHATDYCKAEAGWHVAEYYGAEVTHWMPLPELPEEEER